MVQVTGGMSVDPDDMTPSAIRALGGEVVTYGTPVLPGAIVYAFLCGRCAGCGASGLCHVFETIHL